MAEPLAILLISREHERVHYGFVLAAGAAALGSKVLVFATNGALHGFCADWSGLADTGRDQRLRQAGVAGIEELREAALALGVRLMACEAGLRAEAIPPGRLLPAVERGGVAAFLADAGGRVITL